MVVKHLQLTRYVQCKESLISSRIIRARCMPRDRLIMLTNNDFT